MPRRAQPLTWGQVKKQAATVPADAAVQDGHGNAAGGIRYAPPQPVYILPATRAAAPVTWEYLQRLGGAARVPDTALVYWHPVGKPWPVGHTRTWRDHAGEAYLALARAEPR